MATRKVITARPTPPSPPPCARPGCGHPRARHFRAEGYPASCLHEQLNPGDPCACPDYLTREQARQLAAA